MKIEEIQKIIDEYNNLILLTKSKIEIISEVDLKYDIARGIENISFSNGFVTVICDDTCMSCYDTKTFDFPILWLSKDDMELKTIVFTDMTLRQEKARKKQEEKVLLEQQNIEKMELEEYQRLKVKFENKV